MVGAFCERCAVRNYLAVLSAENQQAVRWVMYEAGATLRDGPQSVCAPRQLAAGRARASDFFVGVAALQERQAPRHGGWARGRLRARLYARDGGRKRLDFEASRILAVGTSSQARWRTERSALLTVHRATKHL